MESLLTYDGGGLTASPGGLDSQDLDSLAPRLETARQAVENDAEQHGQGIPPEPDWTPRDAGFYRLPEELLEEYRRDPQQSLVGRIRAAATQLASEVDRVVVLGIGGSYMGARALLEACCHPYHNELPRHQRSDWPRIYFEGNNVDNDAQQGLLELLATQDGSEAAQDGPPPWAIVVISKSGGTIETAAAFRIFLAALQEATRDAQRLARRVIPVTGDGSQLAKLGEALQCGTTFPVPEGVGGRFSVFSAVGLLPAALMGLDIVALLEGAAELNEHFRTAPVGNNAVLDYVAHSHLMESQRGATIRVLATWGARLEAAGLWYDQLLSESLGKQEQGATPLTVVQSRDLHSRGQQHQQGRRDKLITNLVVTSPSQPPLPLGRSDLDHDRLNRWATKTLPDLLQAALQGTNRAYAQDQRPTAELRLPSLNERSIGQLFQMLMLATVVEGRLIGINPYGQPGVQDYKRCMQEILESSS